MYNTYDTHMEVFYAKCSNKYFSEPLYAIFTNLQKQTDSVSAFRIAKKRFASHSRISGTGANRGTAFCDLFATGGMRVFGTNIRRYAKLFTSRRKAPHG